MENRVLGPTPEETTAAVTTSCGIGTSSPVASAPTNTVTGVGGSGALTSATCTIQNPVVVVASPPTKHQQPAAVLSTIPTVPTVPSVSGVTAAVPKILSRNINGTLVQTSVPQNEAELQLYRVMQRASLLSYYDTLLEMGGDDVQQLCDAGEEEFLEIMALVGMASKPLHVRRLQKALQEWLTNPSLFQTPVVPTTATCKAPAGIGFPCVSPRPQVQNLQGFTTTSQTATPTPYVSSHVSLTPLPCRSTSPIVSVTSVTAPVASTTFRQSPSPNTPLPYTTSHSPGILQVGTCESSCGSGTTPSPSGGGGAPASPTQPTPTLLQSQIQRLAEAAERLAATIRPVDPKPHNVKKKICKNLEMVMAMPDSDPRRMEEIRKYAAIYGRFDCKRKPEKPLTLHEVSVNEAAAQICSLSVSRPRENGEENEPDRTKRQKLELEGENEDATQELDLRCPEMDIGNSTIRRHRSSSPVWRKKNNNGMFSASIEEISDSDSQLSFSNEESSSIHDTNEVEADNTDKESDFNLKVIASRGDNIIAVANPALMECNHPIKEEPTDEKPTL
ncbi:NGFI-A-binding protein homolog isoform X4 [Bombus vosnesenskii]|uniref:NGFI-A-binding protein homolog isoform X4 n=2 Tax=Pyrobombus TaxID=144703 RepID=A0A6J3L328_9HYME|nr:NGFI-A-binding protein homolog isoform X4 [Bombus impatiens]XP_033196149.1 NGFI-A-binding protein homolog isoform X4 [Bombus vancouverensis nearcticus]XP_033358861.1 NGFI-A-binding protein homolog isoform X4 [Bombus vosnesenskii]XP_050475449.1 NGFI-A-binding protein homolog isoform X4 [Bombus huntii]